MLPSDHHELRRRAEARGRRDQQLWPDRDRVLRAIVTRLLDQAEHGEARSVEPGGRGRSPYGAAVIDPNSPSFSSLGPAVKNSVL